MVTLFLSYSHKDEALRDQLEIHLAMLKRQGVISAWHDRRLIAGSDLDAGISQELERAEIILLLVSPDFLASDYCYSVEMTRALERHKAGNARVIPVILRPCDWTYTPFGKLLAAPRDGKPITRWPDADEAFLDIATAIRTAASATSPRPAPSSTTSPPNTQPSRPGTMPMTPATTPPDPTEPRSSNLRVRKIFTDKDRDRFLDDAFEFMARFFENSVEEISRRNPCLEGSFRRDDSSKFTASLYRNGAALARCQIRLGGYTKGITFAHGHFTENSYNESLSIQEGEQSLYLRPTGMPSHRGVSLDSHLTFEGASEYLWSLFIEPAQR